MTRSVSLPNIVNKNSPLYIKAEEQRQNASSFHHRRSAAHKHLQQHVNHIVRLTDPITDAWRNPSHHTQAMVIISPPYARNSPDSSLCTQFPPRISSLVPSYTIHTLRFRAQRKSII
ncbi:hypothetical protein AB1N83_006744 [Pleurotus pulmonarius]